MRGIDGNLYTHELTKGVDRHNKEGVVLSWARGAGGEKGGHFNERDNDYIKVFADLDYLNDAEMEGYLRKRSTLWWFRCGAPLRRDPRP